MGVTADNIKFYASANMPTGDGDTSGGAIDSGIIITFTDVSGTSALNLELLSDNAGDNQNFTLTGRNGAGSIITEQGSLSGTTTVTTSNTFERLLRFTIDSAPNGRITVRDDTAQQTIAQFSGQTSGVYRPFYGAAANAAGGDDKELKEKFFIRNDNNDTALNSVTLQELASGVHAKVTWTVESSQDGSESIASRTGTNPSNTGEAFSSANKNIPGTNLGPQAAIGVWMLLDLDAGDTPDNDIWVLRVNGSTT